MSSIKRVMIAGAGGINSWLVQILSDLAVKGQIPPTWQFTIFDEDCVEKKNLLYQNFTFVDQMENKAKTLGDRYGMLYKSKFVKSPKDFTNFDIVICGVDNKDFRTMLFTYMNDHPEKEWIDLRSEGRVVAAFTKNSKNTLEEMMSTLSTENDTESGSSCQLGFELDSGIIQLGNRIIANIGAQYLLNILRSEISPAKFIYRF